jgi:hypothetical protein
MVAAILLLFKNITRGKPPFCGYFCAISEILPSGINGLTRDAGVSRFPWSRFPDCPDVAILDLQFLLSRFFDVRGPDLPTF